MKTNNKKNKQNNSIVIFSVVVLIILAALLLTEGGFFSFSALFVEAFLVAFSITLYLIKKIKLTISVSTIFIGAIAILMFVSLLLHPINSTSIICVCGAFGLLIFTLLFPSINKLTKLKTKLYSLLIYAGITSSIFAVIGYFLLPGALYFVMSNRLVFPFGYSNVSGIWFLIIAILCICSRKKIFVSLSVLPLIAIVLTMSVGVMILAILSGVILYVLWLKGTLTQKIPNKNQRIVSYVIVLFGVGCICAGCVLLSSRIYQASQTFIERYIQILDSCSLLATSPITGVGPDMWQFVYPFIQTAQYTPAKIHCSYLQLALDGGIVVVFVLLFYIVFSFVKLIKQKQWLSVLLCGVIAIHSLADFDISFPLIVILFIMFVECPVCWDFLDTTNEKNRQHTTTSSKYFRIFTKPAICLTTLIVCLLSCCSGIYFHNQQISAINSASSKQDTPYDKIENLPQYTLNDPKSATYIVIGLVNRQNYNEANKWYDYSAERTFLKTPNTSVQTLYLIKSLESSGYHSKAVEFMSKSLYTQPYNVDLYGMIADYIKTLPNNSDFCDSYNACASYSNALLDQPNANLLAKQEEIDAIDVVSK